MKTLLLLGLGLVILSVFHSCKDAGSEVPITLPAILITSADTVVSVPSDTTSVSISGGTAPYSIVTAPSSSVAVASVTGSTLRVIGAGTGSTGVAVGDAATPQNTKTIPIIIENPISFASQIHPIFNSSYGCASCHSGGASGGLNLDGTIASSNYANLFNIDAQAGCVGKKRVLPRNPQESVFYLRVSSFTCGDRMPKGGSSITAAHLDFIRKWILQGAKNN